MISKNIAEVLDKMYYPAGTLKYLILSPKGDRVVGVYRNRLTHAFVLVVDCFGLTAIFPVHFKVVTDLIEDRMSFRIILMFEGYNVKNAKPMNLLEKIALRFRIMYHLNGTISQLRRVTPYPNYFYEFHTFITHPDTNPSFIEE
jgi:hypothetical protein